MHAKLPTATTRKPRQPAKSVNMESDSAPLSSASAITAQRSPSPDGRITPQLRLTIYMVLTARRWRSLLDDHLRPIGQSAARMEAMWAIAYMPPLSPQVDIARQIGIESATFTRMLDSLEADGLVERRAAASDRRSKHIALTAEGKTQLEAILVIADDVRMRLLSDVPEDDLDEANAFLAMILNRFEQAPILKA